MKTATLCIAAEFERPYLEEWWAWHKKLGFDEIWTITNNWSIDFPAPSYVQTARIDGQVQQLNAYNQWAARFQHMYDWVLVIDVDEFLYLPSGDIHQLLEKASQLEVPAVGFNWVNFGDGGPGTPTSGSVVKRFTRCEGLYNEHVKCAVNLKLMSENGQQVCWCNPHFASISTQWLPSIDANLDKMFNGPYNKLWAGACISKDAPFIAHYYTKTKEEWCKRRGPEHMRADCAQFVGEEWFEKENHNEVECTRLAEKA